MQQCMEGKKSAYMLLYCMERANSPTKEATARNRTSKPVQDFVGWETISSDEPNEISSSDSEFSFEDEYFPEDWAIDAPPESVEEESSGSTVSTSETIKKGK